MSNDDERRGESRREIDRRVTAVVEGMSDAFLAIGPDWRVTYANREAARLNGVPPHRLVGQDHWTVWPETAGSEVERQYRRCVAERVPVQFEHHYPEADVWHDVRAYPADDGGLAVFYRDVTSQKRLEQERIEHARDLAAAIAAAEAANTAKSQFLANTSHEIRTPLNAMMGYAELLECGLAGPLSDLQLRYVGRIQAASRHLLGLVNDVLDLARIEAGHMRAAREPALVDEVVSDALALVEPQAHARQIDVVDGCARGERAYRGDAERVRQILVNLLSNAVRFTEPGGRVTVTCGAATSPPSDMEASVPRAAAWTYVRVEDTGIGIEPSQLGRVWGAFVQADAGRTRRFGGSGLGLTISRHLARLMGGDIIAHSTPGVGSSFVLWLPAADVADVRRASAAPPEPARDVADAADAADVQSATRPTSGYDESAVMRDVARALLTDAERVLSTYVARLRTDPATPSAHRLNDPELEDHGVSLIAELAKELDTQPLAGTAVQRLRTDGVAIRRTIATHHGAQRAAFGWREDELRREYSVLCEEVRSAVRRGARGHAVAESRAVAVVERMLGESERDSLSAFRGGP